MHRPHALRKHPVQMLCVASQDVECPHDIPTEPENETLQATRLGID